MGRPSGHKLDSTDIQIISALQKDPQLGYQELGKLVGLKYSPCRRRVKNLYDGGYITISISLRTEKFLRKQGYCILVEMRDTSPPAIEFFSAEIRAMKEVDCCWELNGTLDFVVCLYVEEEAHFTRLRRNINDMTMDGIRIVLRTQSLPIAVTVKEGSASLESLTILSDED